MSNVRKAAQFDLIEYRMRADIIVSLKLALDDFCSGADADVESMVCSEVF